MQKRILTWCFLLGLAMILGREMAAQTTPPAARVAGQIRVAAVKGTVTATAADGTVIGLQRGSSVEQGHTVNTAAGASVVLAFSNGSTLNLGSETTLSIAKYLQEPLKKQIAVAATEKEDDESSSETELDLRRGELVGNVKTLNKARGSNFTVRTPVGAAGIRGTIFRIVYRPDGTGKAFFAVTTVEGNVEVFSGVVSVPVGVGGNQEVTFTVDVDVTTGQLLSPPQIVTPTAAPLENVSAIRTDVVTSVEAAVETVFGPGSAASEAVRELLLKESPSADATKKDPDTTPTDGRP